MKVKELIYLLYYSFKSFFDDVFDILSELKNPRTWSFIILAAFFLAAYYQKYILMLYTIPAMFFIKIVRDKIEGTYRKHMYERHLIRNKDSKLVLNHYQKYLKDCSYSKKAPLDLKEWKEKEIKNLKNNIE